MVLLLKNHKQILIILLLLIIPFLISGCWGRRETQQMNLSTGLGFDKVLVEGNPQYRITVLSSKPQQGGGGATGSSGGINEPSRNTTSQVIYLDGDTLWDAGRNWNLRSSRRLFIGQVLVVVIGENTARQGIAQIIDFLNRHQDARERVWVIVCRGSAAGFLNAQPEYEPTASLEIAGIMRDAWQRAGKVKGTDLFNVGYDLLTPGKEAVIPYMTTFVPPEPSSPIRQNRTTGQGQASGTQTARQLGSQPQSKSFSIAGSAVFKGDQMVGLLNEKENQGLLFLTNQIKGGAVPIAIASSEKNASIRFKGSQTRIKPIFSQDGIILNVNIKADGDLLEEDDDIFRISKEDFKQAEKATSREIERRCRLALAKSQELNSDIFGFGDKIHRSDPQQWKQIKDQWNDIYPTVQVNINAEFKLKQTGVLSEPLTPQ
ncbi:MAG: Ger(x)C family spore germination protein [Syntrophomonas sp.]